MIELSSSGMGRRGIVPYWEGVNGAKGDNGEAAAQETYDTH